jgi:hypothetical protein
MSSKAVVLSWAAAMAMIVAAVIVAALLVMCVS